MAGRCERSETQSASHRATYLLTYSRKGRAVRLEAKQSERSERLPVFFFFKLWLQEQDGMTE